VAPAEASAVLDSGAAVYPEGTSNDFGSASTHWIEVTSALVVVTRVSPCATIVAELEARSGVLLGSLAWAAFSFFANSGLPLPNMLAISLPLSVAKGLSTPLMSLA